MPLTNSHIHCACFVMQLMVAWHNLSKFWCGIQNVYVCQMFDLYVSFAPFFASVDFSGPVPSVVTFLAGDGPGTFRNTVFTIVNDSTIESNETILISGTSLSALGQFEAGGDTAVITITNDDGGC